MNGIASNHLNRLMRRAKKKDIEATNSKNKAINEFYKEFSAGDLETMLNVVETHGQTYEQEQARNIHEKIRNCEKLGFDDANKCLTLFEANYQNFLNSEEDDENRGERDD